MALGTAAGDDANTCDIRDETGGCRTLIEWNACRVDRKRGGNQISVHRK